MSNIGYPSIHLEKESNSMKNLFPIKDPTKCKSTLTHAATDATTAAHSVVLCKRENFALFLQYINRFQNTKPITWLVLSYEQPGIIVI